MMSKKMRVFAMLFLGVVVGFLSFTLVFYSSIREMRANYQAAVQNGEVAPPPPNAQVGRLRERSSSQSDVQVYSFRSTEIRDEMYESFGTDMGFSSSETYELGASSAVNDSDALCKIERQTANRWYYVEATNELVIVSYDGYIESYFCPEGGKEYFDSI